MFFARIVFFTSELGSESERIATRSRQRWRPMIRLLPLTPFDQVELRPIDVMTFFVSLNLFQWRQPLNCLDRSSGFNATFHRPQR